MADLLGVHSPFSRVSHIVPCSSFHQVALTDADIMTATTCETFHISFAFSAQIVLLEVNITSSGLLKNIPTGLCIRNGLTAIR